MQNWDNFFMTAAGVSATLSGLIFVGLSINLKEIIAQRSLPLRAALALILLLIVLLTAVVFIAPLPIWVEGIIIAVIGILLWIIIFYNDIAIFKHTPEKYKRMIIVHILMHQICTVPYIIGGILMINGNTAGFYFVMVAYLTSIVKGVYDAWVLMIEIMR